MKQFFHINYKHYALDSVTGIHVEEKDMADIIADMAYELEEAIDKAKRDKKPVTLGKIDPKMCQWIIVIDLQGDDSVYANIPEGYIECPCQVDQFQQYFVEKMASSNEPIIEANEIIEDYNQHITEQMPVEGNI